MRINTNMGALSTQRSLSSISSRLSKSVERLASGSRIARAADDAAGLAISEKLRAQTRGLTQSARNAQDAISMIQTAEGAMNETHNVLQRMRELAVQAANDTLTSTDREAIASEMSSLRAEVDRIADDTEFNTKTLLNGNMQTSNAGVAATDLVSSEVLGSSNVTATVTLSGAAANTTFTMTAAGSSGITMTATIGGATLSQSVLIGFMTDAATGAQTLNFSTFGIKIDLTGGNAAGTQANIVMNLISAANDTIVTGAVSTFASTPTSANAQALIMSLDDAIADVSVFRSSLGALQNRLEHAVENMTTTAENMTASESRIRDADMSVEMGQFTRNSILTQAGTSILAQANQLPQGVLTLLR